LFETPSGLHRVLSDAVATHALNPSGGTGCEFGNEQLVEQVRAGLRELHIGAALVLPKPAALVRYLAGFPMMIVLIPLNRELLVQIDRSIHLGDLLLKRGSFWSFSHCGHLTLKPLLVRV
jgi:hypothetical protein